MSINQTKINKWRWWLWPVLVPCLPVVLSVLVLEYIGVPPSFSLLNLGEISNTAALLSQGSERLLYGCSVIVHITVCILAAIYFIRTIAQLHVNDRKCVYLAVSLICIFVVISMIALTYVKLHGNPLVIYQYTYFIFKELLEVSKTTDWLHHHQLGVLIMLPSALGVISVLIAAGAACSSLKLAHSNSISSPCLGENEISEEYDLNFINAHDDRNLDLRSDVKKIYNSEFSSKAMQQFKSGIYILSTVLVTSTISAMLFFKMTVNPYINVIECNPEARTPYLVYNSELYDLTRSENITIPNTLSTRNITCEAKVSAIKYINGITIFWGVIYTLTLSSVYIGPIVALYFMAQKTVHRQNAKQHLSFIAWLRENNTIRGVSQSFQDIIILLAPLLIAMINELVTIVK